VPDVYEGGARIDAFRSLAKPGGGPEDWVGSVTYASKGARERLGKPELGLSLLPDGSTLRRRIAEDPEGWLGGSAHSSDDTGILVKLLDAGERLPVHFHPPEWFATSRLGAPNGKTEAWIVLDCEPESVVWLGFMEALSIAEIRALIREQRPEGFLELMNRIPARRGDVFYVPAGLPHSIDSGLLITEIQEPSSLSILLEYASFGVSESAAHLGLGWDEALEALDRTGYGGALDHLCPKPRPVLQSSQGSVVELLPEEAGGLFRVQRVLVRGRLEVERRFSIVIVEFGEGALEWDGGKAPLKSGETWVVPFGARDVAFRGQLDLLLCMQGERTFKTIGKDTSALEKQ
jgi:mannose-6-phosphate isomerase